MCTARNQHPLVRVYGSSYWSWYHRRSTRCEAIQMASFFDIHNGYQNKPPPPWTLVTVGNMFCKLIFITWWILTTFGCFRVAILLSFSKKNSHQIQSKNLPSAICLIIKFHPFGKMDLPFRGLATRRSGFVDDANREAPHLGGSGQLRPSIRRGQGRSDPRRPVGPWQLLRWTRCAKKWPEMLDETFCRQGKCEGTRTPPIPKGNNKAFI